MYPQCLIVVLPLGIVVPHLLRKRKRHIKNPDTTRRKQSGVRMQNVTTRLHRATSQNGERPSSGPECFAFAVTNVGTTGSPRQNTQMSERRLSSPFPWYRRVRLPLAHAPYLMTYPY